MTDILRPGFQLRMNSELYNKKEEEEEEYLLKWGEHNNQVVNIFHQLCQVRTYQISRNTWFLIDILLQENLLTDVTLATETKQFKAHKLILSACSPYFRNLFVSSFSLFMASFNYAVFSSKILSLVMGQAIKLTT